MAFVRVIPVEDSNGDRIALYEFQDRRFITKVRRLKLETGECVEPVCERTFIVPATGEKLTLAAE
jgi:hypothetical protein